MAKFVCKVCGYVYEGDAAPAECPVCHVGADMFEEVKGEIISKRTETYNSVILCYFIWHVKVEPGRS